VTEPAPSSISTSSLPDRTELGVLLAQMGAVLLSTETVGTTVELVTALAAEAIPGAAGAGVTLVDDRGLALFGVSGVIGLFLVEAIVFPVLAERSPQLLDIHGPLLGSPLLVGTGLLALGWPLGFAMLGIAAARNGLFGRAPGGASRGQRAGLSCLGRAVPPRGRAGLLGGFRHRSGVVGLAAVDRPSVASELEPRVVVVEGR
jgi:hypothetical protein